MYLALSESTRPPQCDRLRGDHSRAGAPRPLALSLNPRAREREANGSASTSARIFGGICVEKVHGARGSGVTGPLVIFFGAISAYHCGLASSLLPTRPEVSIFLRTFVWYRVAEP
ncbi:hypothetical protein BD311DRAFT_762062 [Dichomitus squalens]|uniref:Uncharacterized protein n=1 Tax=Dichomitus squalens TaxID=114155 RepID=A0A4Q9MGU8_9APHY|nr:hypothetical protein BD311DRAFT_762062 [Dichomitus squalens]